MAIEAGSQSPFMHTAHYIHNVQRYAQSMNAPQSIDVLEWLERMEEWAQGEVVLTSQGRFSRFGAVGVGIALISMDSISRHHAGCRSLQAMDKSPTACIRCLKFCISTLIKPRRS